jgi:cytochrome P450
MSEHDTTPIDGCTVAAGFDPNRLGPEFYENPYPTYAALGAFDPVHRCPDGTYFLTQHADLDRIYRDRHHFSSDKKAVFAPKFGIAAPLYEHHTTSLVFKDPPYHARVRRQIVGNSLHALLHDPGSLLKLRDTPQLIGSAFGAGAHACAGMSVARLEARIAILKAIQRLRGLHLTAVPTRDARARFRGFRSLPAAT